MMTSVLIMLGGESDDYKVFRPISSGINDLQTGG